MSDVTPVLVVGAGPVGLTAAHELGRRGVPVRLVDAAEGPAATSRAMATHPRTLETYDQMGVVDAMLALGQRVEGFTMFQRGRRLVRLDADYSRNPTRFPFTLSIDQVRTEEVLRQAVHRLGVKVEWGVRLASFRQDATGVDVRLERAGGATAEELRVPWLVGCDGGHSTVRKALGLRLLGDSNDTWLLADAEVLVDLPRDSIYWMHAGTGTMMLVPLPGKDRWRMLDTADVAYDGDPRRLGDRFARKLSTALGRPVAVDTPDWVSVFTAQQRMVETMRVGRCLLAGDAAHVHSPASGQGMNTGVQEAFNLAWKLALVHTGTSAPELLDSYSQERTPIGARLLESTRNATRLVALRAALAGVFLPVFFAVVRALPPLRRRIQHSVLSAMSGLAIDYPDSPLTRRPQPPGATRPQPGQRLASVLRPPQDGPEWQALLEEVRDSRVSLLLFAGARAQETERLADRLRQDRGQWLSVRPVGPGDPARGWLPDPGGDVRAAVCADPGGWLLLRPDGYIAARGTGTEPSALRDAFEGLRLARPPSFAPPRTPVEEGAS